MKTERGEVKLVLGFLPFLKVPTCLFQLPTQILSFITESPHAHPNGRTEKCQCNPLHKLNVFKHFILNKPRLFNTERMLGFFSTLHPTNNRASDGNLPFKLY